ncbi:MAG: serine--tRNA ligase, partial [Candidatus Omnitrophica bacterium]|nr:serine--tRNA ligase [Candidatus Omnitrophota bacterium]
MLDIKFIRENKDLVKQSIINRALKIDIDAVISIDDSRRKALSEFEELAARRNKANDEISVLLKEKKDAKSKISS